MIIPGSFGGNARTDLLFYKRTGVGFFASTDGNGNLTPIKQHVDWDRDWDVIVPGNFGGSNHTDLLFYKRSTGTGYFASTDGLGNVSTIKQHSDWDRDWDAIIPGNFGGDSRTDLLFYKRSGVGSFARTDGQGNLRTLKEHTNWDRDWDAIIPGSFGGNVRTDLLFYRRSTGTGFFANTDGQANISPLKQYSNWDRDWTVIVPGNFGRTSFTDLLFYTTRRLKPERPADLRVTSVTPGRIDVSWTDRSLNEDGFRVRFHGRRQGLSDHTGTKSVGRNAQSASLTGLLNRYEYTISVIAFNAGGESQSSNEVRVTTPNAPQPIRVRLQRQDIVAGPVPYVGSYPQGIEPTGRVLQLRLPPIGFADTAVSFVRRGHSTGQCSDPMAVVTLPEGGMTNPEQMAAIFGVAEPGYSSLNPIGFLACVTAPASAPIPDSVEIEITIMET
jgi:hypothetical protein